MQTSIVAAPRRNNCGTGAIIVAHGLQSAGSVVGAHRLSCPKA